MRKRAGLHIWENIHIFYSTNDENIHYIFQKYNKQIMLKLGRCPTNVLEKYKFKDINLEQLLDLAYLLFRQIFFYQFREDLSHSLHERTFWYLLLFPHHRLSFFE